MTRHALKQGASLAIAGAFALTLAATAAPLSIASKAAVIDQTTIAQQVNIEPIAYHHYYHHYRHYGLNPGAAVAGTALGLIGGAIAGAEGYPYGYGYGYGPYYSYGYGPGYYGAW